MARNLAGVLTVLCLCTALSSAAQAWDRHDHGYSQGYGGYGGSYRPVFPTRPFFAEPRHRVERGQAYREGYRDGYGHGYGRGYGDGYRDRDIQRRHPWSHGYGSRYQAPSGNAYGWSGGSRAREGYRARSGGGWMH